MIFLAFSMPISFPLHTPLKRFSLSYLGLKYAEAVEKYGEDFFIGETYTKVIIIKG